MKKPYLVLLAISIVLVLVAPTFAVPKVNLAHRYTWDVDMINSDLANGLGYTGAGVYVAVLDTGLTPNWRDYFPQERIATKLGIGFYQHVQIENTEACDNIVKTEPIHTTSFIGSTGETHGTHVISTIIGYNYYAPADAAAGYPLPPIFVEGIAPEATIIPVKVLTTYHFPCGTGPEGVTFGTDEMVAAGIYYATNLKLAGYTPMIITMSLGGPEPTDTIEDAVDYAISNGVIVIAAAGNAGDEGMDWPGAYPQVISAGAAGWGYEWYAPTASPPPRYRLWWLQDNTYGYRDIPEPTPASDVYITDFSGREKTGQQLDVVAPGSWVRGPFPGVPGYSHLPWWSEGLGWLVGRNPGNFYYAGGTSMATPHVTAVAAMMLEKDPTLTQAQVETIMKSTALPISPGSMMIYDISPIPDWYTKTWGSDATGAGLIQADAAVAAVP